MRTSTFVEEKNKSGEDELKKMLDESKNDNDQKLEKTIDESSS